MAKVHVFTCIACGYQGKWRLWRRFPTFLFGVPFEVWRCPECGLGRTCPKPEVGVEHYEDNQRYNILFVEKRELYLKFAEALLKTLDDLIAPQGKKLLDIGCGGGFVVEYANQIGFQAEGVDANRQMVAFGRQQGLNVYQADVMEVSFGGADRYDVIVLSAILEHLPDPAKLLNHIRANLLKDDGFLLVSQASYDGLLPRLFPWGWYGWQPQEHFWHFTPASFGALSRRCGFVCRRLQRKSLYHPWFVTSRLRDLVGRNFAAILARIGYAIGRGDSFDCVLQKNAR